MVRLTDKNGFTLIEALVAMFVLTVGILAIFTMQMNGTEGNTTANKLTVASSIAGNSFERLLNMPYDDATMDPNTNPHTDAELTGIQLPSNVTSITWTVTEWRVDDNLDNDGDGTIDEPDELDLKFVALNINYVDRVNKTLTINFCKSEMF